MTSDNPIRDEEIHRFLDGELSAAQRADLQARLSLNPARAAEVFAEAQRMEALRQSQRQHIFPQRASLEAAGRLERTFWRRGIIATAQLPVAAISLFAAGWVASSVVAPQLGQTVDQNFVLAAREALRVAQLDAGPSQETEHKQQKIERLVGAINIGVPPLPSNWKVTDVQVQPWEGRQSLVVTAITPRLGQITLVAAPMADEEAVPLTLAADGRIPTVYWQSGGTAYALMGPVASERLQREAKDIEVSTRRNLGPKFRG
ncbi:MAG: anti-sigma factor [Rhizobiaceae bacterium]